MTQPAMVRADGGKEQGSEEDSERDRAGPTTEQVCQEVTGDQDADKRQVELELVAECPEDRDQVTVPEDVLQVREMRDELRNRRQRGCQRWKSRATQKDEAHLQSDRRPVWGIEPDGAPQREAAEIAERHRSFAHRAGNDKSAQDEEDVDAKVSAVGKSAPGIGDPGLLAPVEGGLHVIENDGKRGQPAKGIDRANSAAVRTR